MRQRLFLLWFLHVLLGFRVVSHTAWSMLSPVRKIAKAASRIGHSDLTARVPATRERNEVSHIALTLNQMLDRIESSMHQLHSITDSPAHDLRSPLTAIRSKSEMSLSASKNVEEADPIVAAIDELDRPTDSPNKSLDVAEAKADALRLDRAQLDQDELLRIMIDLYKPSMSEKGLQLNLSRLLANCLCGCRRGSDQLLIELRDR
jgi:signal transduction histidine kinase